MKNTKNILKNVQLYTKLYKGSKIIFYDIHDRQEAIIKVFSDINKSLVPVPSHLFALNNNWYHSYLKEGDIITKHISILEAMQWIKIEYAPLISIISKIDNDKIRIDLQYSNKTIRLYHTSICAISIEKAFEDMNQHIETNSKKRMLKSYFLKKLDEI